jgi:hypothetical protein
MVILLIGKALTATPPPKLSTAVFTLDADQRLLQQTPDNPLAGQMERWAGQCEIQPGGAVAELACPPADAAETRKTDDPSETIPAALALFRDLNETVYLAGCPLIEKTPAGGAAPQDGQTESEKLKAEDLRNCRDIAAGQTFSAEVEGDVLRAVVRGRQLAFRVFRVQQKPQTIDTPYVPSPSRRMPPTGPATRGERKGLEPQTEPHWEPTELTAPSAGKPSESRVSGVAPAHTSLRTGRITIQCPSREFAVLIDGVYIGTCPITTTLIAGPHTIAVRPPGQPEQIREIQVEAGKSIQLRMNGS